MGNYISCTLSAPAAKHSRTTKVIFPNGEIKQFHQPIKAAEIMLETPNFFLVNSKSLQMGRRFSALNADEDLEPTNAYVLFPMKRLNSVVMAADLGALFLTANSAAKRVTAGHVRISPECGEVMGIVSEPTKREEAAVRTLDLEEVEESSALEMEFKYRSSMCRSKKPLLETIAEETVCS